MKEPKIALIIVNYNQQHFLDTCLDSIFGQTYKNIDVYFIDNNSPDTAYLKFLTKKYPFKEVIANKENLGYPTAANQGMRLAKDADYIVVTNPDIIYSPSYIEKIVHRIKKDPRIGAATGKIYKYDFKEKTATKYIDTTGLYIDKSMRVTDGGQGCLDKGQFDREREVFGVSGACPIYKKEAL
ncbi:glycosyltransferase, partial [Candidatus Peregrinibacteria bacterium]|nr:glycosyltransferase [Candidatus Peregrinibacteria bacterium]